MVRSLLWMALTIGVFPLCGLSQDRQAHSVSHWNQWRGPLGTGVAPDARPPVEWSNDKNIRWKTSLPGRGHSSPVLGADHVFVTTAIPVGPKLPPRMSGRPGEHDICRLTVSINSWSWQSIVIREPFSGKKWFVKRCRWKLATRPEVWPRPRR